MHADWQMVSGSAAAAVCSVTFGPWFNKGGGCGGRHDVVTFCAYWKCYKGIISISKDISSESWQSGEFNFTNKLLFHTSYSRRRRICNEFQPFGKKVYT